MQRHLHRLMLAAAFLITAAVYWPGLSGGYLFDDYPNIVDNAGVQPHDASVSSLVRAALSSPSSDFKRPLASLSFAVNYLVTGLDPYWMKLTNLALHLLNGLLVFMLSRSLLRATRRIREKDGATWSLQRATASFINCNAASEAGARTRTQPTGASRTGIVAALIAVSWMLLPINLTGVLYVVQRMESMANLFVLLGLIGYVAGRRRMLDMSAAATHEPGAWPRISRASRGFVLCFLSITVPAAIGILAKETAVMLPLYALLVEWALFGFRGARSCALVAVREPSPPRRDRRIIALFMLVLALPMVLGLAWLIPGVLNPQAWATRDFTLATRLLTEARVVVDYIGWTLLPTPAALSFYHDDFRISTGLLAPWSTLFSILLLAGLLTLAIVLRKRQPLAALGLALFFGCQLLTGTVLPLELIYEHRNYFASFGLLLAIIPLLAAPSSSTDRAEFTATIGSASVTNPQFEQMTQTPEPAAIAVPKRDRGLPMALPRYALLAGLMLFWTTLTALTARAWSNPLRLAADLANRAPQSPRAQYELGRTYIIYSNYDPASPFTRLAYAPLEKAAALPDGSILPEQALIFMNARMHLPVKDAWWDSMIAKLRAHRPGVQDESSLAALTQCVREHRCTLPERRMMDAFLAAVGHPNPSARLLATYGDYAWNVLNDHELGERMTEEAVEATPNEPAYQITLIRMLAAQGRKDEAEEALRTLSTLNIGGRLDGSIAELRSLPSLQ